MSLSVNVQACCRVEYDLSGTFSREMLCLFSCVIYKYARVQRKILGSTKECVQLWEETIISLKNIYGDH